MKINIIQHLLIEITRECNLSCAHCLRGKAERGVIQTEYLEELFSQIENIGTLTITGGEPSLYPEKIEEIVSLAKTYKVNIDNFYIAINGTIASAEFLTALMNLWLYCSDNEISGVNVSNDVFHEREWELNYEKLSILKFVSKKYIEDDYDYNKYSQILAEGYGANLSEKENNNSISIDDILREELEEELAQTLNDSEFYLNCKGNIILGCDWSYESQDDPKNILCSVQEFANVYEAFFHKLKLKENYYVCD